MISYCICTAFFSHTEIKISKIYQKRENPTAQILSYINEFHAISTNFDIG